jgi:hypothetical protein
MSDGDHDPDPIGSGGRVTSVNAHITALMGGALARTPGPT